MTLLDPYDYRELADSIGLGWMLADKGCKGREMRVWRLRSESNRRTRLCRPLHDHSAT
jgi:hypothetical protein